MKNILNAVETAKAAVEDLLAYAKQHLKMDTLDEDYNRNALLSILGLDAPAPAVSQFTGDFQTEIMDKLTAYAIAKGLIQEGEEVLFETKLFGVVSPLPSAVIAEFCRLSEAGGPQAATDWLFDWSKANNYIRMRDIQKNIVWTHTGTFGPLRVTINLSKPEKTPEQIAAAAAAKKADYPACMLCPSNVGVAGSIHYPARQTLRVIPIELGGEPWGMQYSPYQYYDEHTIAFSMAHRPMKVDRDCLARLLDFVTLFPHYFMGSNAALPIVGGSILTHDHYQGGGKVLPMFEAGIRHTFKSDHHPSVEFSVVDWYNSVVRVASADRQKTLDAANYVLERWSTYSDEQVGILAKTDAQHNAVTPVARFENGLYMMDLILRNNRTDKDHPFGIYHPTQDLHNIKKEGIGIIEVMGIFILPGRLKQELQSIQEFLEGKRIFSDESIRAAKLETHSDMLRQLLDKFGNENKPSESAKIVTDHVNAVCEKILECTAVFKNSETGRAAFLRFMREGLGLQKS